MHFWGVDNMWTLLQYNKNLVIFPIKKKGKNIENVSGCSYFMYFCCCYLEEKYFGPNQISWLIVKYPDFISSNRTI